MQEARVRIRELLAENFKLNEIAYTPHCAILYKGTDILKSAHRTNGKKWRKKWHSIVFWKMQ